MEDKQFVLAADFAHRLAAIDVGTNSIRLIIAEALRGGNYRILDEEKATTRLGRGLGTTGRLDPGAVEQSLEALRRMKQIAAGFQVHDLRCIATCAVREAHDGPDFCRRAKQEIGLDVEIISGKQEAHLAFVSVARNFNLDGQNTAVVDIGGGSTEIVLASGNLVEAICTTPLGAVRLSDLYGQGQAMSNELFAEMLDVIDRQIRRHTKKAMLRPHVLIGSGGTFTTLAEMIMAGKGQVNAPLRGSEVSRAEVRHLLEKLRKMPADARRTLAGLSPDRADIIVAGVAIVDRVMRHFGLNRALIHDRGVRDGLLLTMIDKAVGPSGDNGQEQDSAVERFAAQCGVDLGHGQQVARLAGRIFSQVAERFGLDPADRRLLEAAGRLQDVGYLINYEQHHKHSYYLILNSRLSGFHPHELELIANMARYHRGAEPKKKHANFQQLPGKDQRRVRQLSAILRMAGGLDRSNTQQVEDVVIDGDGDQLRMYVIAKELPEVDLWTVERRTSPFEKTFDVKLDVEWRPTSQASAAV